MTAGADRILEGEAWNDLTVDLGERSYQILIGFADLDRLGASLQALNLDKHLCLITNTTVGRLYGGRVKSVLADAGYTVSYYEVPDGEEYKTLQSAAAIYDHMVDAGMERDSAVVALGGGVVGDLAGFVAATYMRGVPLVQVPTTLLAQVDSSVGGKVAVNHPRGKNLIGCFYQPRLVFADLQTLGTLPEREIRAGMAEVIKYGVIWDVDIFRISGAAPRPDLEPGTRRPDGGGQTVLRHQGGDRLQG